MNIHIMHYSTCIIKHMFIMYLFAKNKTEYACESSTHIWSTRQHHFPKTWRQNGIPVLFSGESVYELCQATILLQCRHHHP